MDGWDGKSGGAKGGVGGEGVWSWRGGYVDLEWDDVYTETRGDTTLQERALHRIISLKMRSCSFV